jgi:protein-L-isoaspartate(D-aspartate) O-methyltransferase
MDFRDARTRLIDHLRERIRDERVIKAIARVPREYFVPPEKQDRAYENTALPIGFGQSISQPFIVALMTEALGLNATQKVLEIGTGSGYQAAILAELARSVITIERIAGLAEHARLILNDLGYRNITVHLARDTMGWLEEAPYDAIIVTAGAPKIPDELIDQLSIGGCMVIPIGSYFFQELCKITKLEGNIDTKHLSSCFFVPLIGKGAWEE